MMKSHRVAGWKAALVLGGLFLCAMGTSSRAAVVTFYGADSNVVQGGAKPNADAARNSFLAASGTPTGVITFENSSLGFFTNLTVAPGLDLAYAGGENAFGSGINNAGAADGGILGFNVTPGGSQFLRIVPFFGTPGAPATATFAFLTPVTAFGAYLTGTESAVDGRISLNFNDGSAQQINVTKTNPSGALFVGFVSTVAVSSVAIRIDGPFSSRDVFGVDDVYYRSSTVVVPEPSSLALAGVGLVGAVVIRARRRKGGVA